MNGASEFCTSEFFRIFALFCVRREAREKKRIRQGLPDCHCMTLSELTLPSHIPLLQSIFSLKLKNVRQILVSFELLEIVEKKQLGSSCLLDDSLSDGRI